MEYTQTETKIARLEYELNNLINSLRSIRGDIEDLKKDLEKMRQEKSTVVHNHYHYPHGYYWHYPSTITYTNMEPGKIYPANDLKITYGNNTSTTPSKTFIDNVRFKPED